MTHHPAPPPVRWPASRATGTAQPQRAGVPRHDPPPIPPPVVFRTPESPKTVQPRGALPPVPAPVQVSPPPIVWPKGARPPAAAQKAFQPKAVVQLPPRVVQRADSDDEWVPSKSPTIPRSQWSTKRVSGVDYKFYNSGDGTLDFFNPWGTYPACPHAGGTWDVNIIDTNTDTLLHTGEAVKNTRYQHFKVANIIREGKNPPVNGGSSPTGYTWHHHKDRGRLQLIDRDVHAAFPHVGGESIWGS